MQKQVIAEIKDLQKAKVLSHKIDINTAPLEHLQCLDLSIDVLDNIVARRTERPFHSKKDLQSVYGVGPKNLDKNLPIFATFGR